MDEPYDPHNGAAVLRSADAFGLQRVHVVPRSDGFAVSGNVARGTQRWVDVLVHDGPASALHALREAGFTLVATHPQGELLPQALRGIPKLALVLGNEHGGICTELAQGADQSVRVPMRGFVESLNVSVCAAILLSAATEGRTGDLDATELRFLYARGLFRTVTRADEVLAALEPPARTPSIATLHRRSR
jgi:tRNA (guanosine-2'-O-)-methyltransferase